MADKTGIEWTAATLAREARAAFGNSFDQEIGGRDSLARHPLPHVTITLGTVARPAGRDDVVGSRSAAALDRNNVIPSFSWAWTVGAAPLEIFEQILLADLRNSLDATFSERRMGAAPLPKRRGARISCAMLGVRMRLAQPFVRPAGANPRTARSAPRHSGHALHSPLTDRWARRRSIAPAVRANVREPASPRCVANEVGWLPITATCAASPGRIFKEVCHG